MGLRERGGAKGMKGWGEANGMKGWGLSEGAFPFHVIILQLLPWL